MEFVNKNCLIEKKDNQAHIADMQYSTVSSLYKSKLLKCSELSILKKTTVVSIMHYSGKIISNDFTRVKKFTQVPVLHYYVHNSFHQSPTEKDVGRQDVY